MEFEKTEFTLKLQKSEWEYVLAKNTESNRTRMEWTQVLKDVETPANYTLDKESAVITLPNLLDGNYILTATSKSGLETKLEFWHWSGAAGSVHSANPNIITATSDREKYLPGENATLKFFANSDGACFVAAGEEKVDFTGAFDVRRGENSITIPIDTTALTSRYQVAITVAGTVDGNVTRGFGLLGLKLDQTANRLGLKLVAPEKAEPNQKITVKLKAVEAATAQIFAVDEGILALTKFKTPDIFDFFHGDYSSTFVTYDIYSLLYPKLAIDRVDKVGGGDEGDALRRPKLKEKESAVVVLGSVEIPQDGTATAELELPEHTGAMRIMVVAAGATKVDSTDATIIMRDRISVLPSLPLAVAVGDRFQGTFKLFNHDIDGSDAKLSVTLPPEIKADGDAEFSVKLAKGETATCRMPLTALGNGAFPVEYKLDLGGKTVTGKVYVNVRSVMPYMTDAKQTVLKPGETLELPAVTDEWQSIAAREIKVSSNPASAVKDALGWLNDYPYGCLEQTTSKAFPMLFVDSLISAGLIDEGFKPQSRQKVNAAVAALLAMRRGSRGFVGWIDSDTIWDGPGVYAAHFLFLSKSNLLTDNDINGINLFLTEKMRDGSAVEKAYAFYVRSLMPMSVETLQKLSDWVLEDSKDNALTRFLTGAAYYNAAHATKGSALVKDALDEKVWMHSSVGLPWMLSSQTVRTSLILSLAMDIVPDHPATMTMAMELASYLRKDHRCWGTTRDNAFASVALGKFAAYHKHGEMAVQITEGTEPPVESKSDNFTRKLAKDSKVTVRNIGKSDLFIRLTTGGIPVKVSHDKDMVSVKKEILDMDGNPVSKVKHGDLLKVKLSINTVAWIEDAVILDLVPGGFSIEDGTLATRANQAERVEADIKNRPYITRQEKLADRFILFGSIPNHRESVVTYRIRAVTPGTYVVPPTRIEDMYEPDKCGTGDCDQSIVIELP